MSSESSPAFFFVVAVWGQKYVDMFLGLALPTFLSPGNLPALTDPGRSRFLILTTPQDQARIEASAVFRMLRTVVEPLFVESPWIEQSTPYHLKAARCHRAAAELAASENGYCVYLCPDCLLSDGSIRHLEKMARAGKQAVMTPGLRLVSESVTEELERSGRLTESVPLMFSGRELVGFAMRHLHLEVQRYNWDHPQFAEHPHMCTWKVPGDAGLLVRAFHLHPMMVSLAGAPDFTTLEFSTIDGDFLGRNVIDWERIHIETDSDNLAIFSLTGRDERFAPLQAHTADVLSIQEMAYSPVVNPLHRWFFTKAIKLHDGDLGENWWTVEKQTASLVYPILQFAPESPAYLHRVPWRNLFSELRSRVPRRAARAMRRILPSHHASNH